MIINMLILERSYDDFMILSYDKVMITNKFSDVNYFGAVNWYCIVKYARAV